MSKILMGFPAREKIIRGANTIADAVRVTLGPKGRNVILGANSVITNDGVTIARAVKIDDEMEHLGADVIRQASQKTNEIAGDGTTSAIVLANEILTLANKQIANGESPVLIKNGLTRACDIITDYVEKNAEKCDTEEKLLAVTTNSCASENDGKIVANALARVGVDGVVIIEENSRGVTEMSVCDGLECPVALCSPYFAQNPARLESVILDGNVVVYNGVIDKIGDLVHALELSQKMGQITPEITPLKRGGKTPPKTSKSVVVFAHDFDPEVTAGLVLNRIRGGLDVTAISCKRTHDAEAVIGDIASVTGATVIGATMDTRLCDVTESDFGYAEKIIVGMQSTKIITPKIDEVEKRAEQIRGQISASRDEYMTAKLRERLARLTGGVAIISVGSATQIETTERKLRFDDALMAGLCARKSGIVCGGGVTYLRASAYLEKQIRRLKSSERLGARVLCDALSAILKQICVNAGVSFDVVLKRVVGSKNARMGYDALNGKFVDMFRANIVDPCAVITNVVRNATSVAGTLLTTEGIVM